MVLNMESKISNILNLLLKNPVTLDVETTTVAKGSPYNPQNQLILIQIGLANGEVLCFTKERFTEASRYLLEASIIIGTNLKFDLAWIKRELGLTFSSVWDLQLAEFLFSKQQWMYPDLDTMAKNYGVGEKLTFIEDNYWSKDIDTLEIPIEELITYGIHDVKLTTAVFKEQIKLFKTQYQNQFKLFRIHCNDLLVLLDMEWNGILYDVDGSLEKSNEITKEVEKIDGILYAFCNAPLNFGSTDHVSCLLYGGTVVEDYKLPIGVYKSGIKEGQTRYKWFTKEYNLPRLVEPIKGSELKKEGYYSTEDTTLVSLKTNKISKKIIDLLRKRRELLKLQSTYLIGLPKVIEKWGWINNVIHSTLNQCVTITGRLSSSKPNQQNVSAEAKKFCITRYNLC